MSKKSIKPEDQCPISFALEQLGDRWSLLIIRDLVFKGKTRYSEFADSPEKISTNILANRLARLEEAQIIEKSANPTNGSSYIYRLTDKGKDLIPLLLEMTAWSAQHNPQSNSPDSIIAGAPRHLLRRLRKDRAGLILEIAEAIG